MKIGIYKITNKINGHCYIGQSTQIERRWENHKEAAYNPNNPCYNYPLYCAFRKYGINNFTFEILEECDNADLNMEEFYWISYYKPQYNQTIGGDYSVVPQKLTVAQAQEIQEILINDKEGKISHTALAQQYKVHKDTIRDINVGRTWVNSNLNYPLHYSKFDSNKPEERKKIQCPLCGKSMSKGAQICRKCNNKKRTTPLTQIPITKQELKDGIKNSNFTALGKKYGVSDNTIRKWCKKFGLPTTISEIKKIPDDEWNKI